MTSFVTLPTAYLLNILFLLTERGNRKFGTGNREPKSVGCGLGFFKKYLLSSGIATGGPNVLSCHLANHGHLALIGKPF